MKPGENVRYFETDKEFYRKLLRIALPIIGQSIITTGVNLVDTMMLGTLGETALSASSLANQFIALFLFCCMGIAMGTSVLASRYWGSQDFTALKKVITIALRVMLVIAVLTTIVTVLLPERIMGLYSREREVIAGGVVYLRWSTATFLLMALSTVCTNVLRSTNQTRIPLLASIAAFAINIGANYVLIFGHLGAPAMGIAGAALGTVIARVVETGVICGYFFLADRRIRYRVRDLLCRCGDLLREFIKTSIPVLVSDGLLGVGDTVLAMIMGRIGSQFVSANAITMVTQRVSTVFITGLAFAGCIMTGHTLGQKRLPEARRQGNTFFLLGLLIGGLAGGAIFLIKGPIIGAYNITAETRSLTGQLMNAISIIIVFRATNSVLTKGVLRGGGDTRFLMVADLLTMWLFAIPLGAMAGLVWQLSPFWIFIFLHIDQVIKAVWCVFRLRSGKWIKAVKGSGAAAERGMEAEAV